jgi:hypothetical protein
MASPPHSTGEATMTLRQFLWDNFGFDIYEWDEADIRF